MEIIPDFAIGYIKFAKLAIYFLVRQIMTEYVAEMWYKKDVFRGSFLILPESAEKEEIERGRRPNGRRPKAKKWKLKKQGESYL